MTNYTNTSGISLAMAVWLAHDEYDGKSPDPYTISATGLLKSTRQVVLQMRTPPEEERIDISGLIKSRIGSAIHDAVERAWKHQRLPATLKALGYPDSLIKDVEINPLEISAGKIAVYLEQRNTKQLGKWKITGKFDMVLAGSLSDIKSTSTFTYVKGIKDDDYIKQGSVYRWLNPTKITSDVMTIDFVFTDWKQSMIHTENYPPAQIFNKSFSLLSEVDTENFIKERLNFIELHENTPEPDLPYCTDSELWRSEATWKYYKSGQVTARSTKNFDNAAEAYARKLQDGGTGLVVEIKGAPTACLYCPVATSCSQKDIYIASGELVI